jgi:3-oxoacyl-ACP reductase-like protein
MNMAAMKAKHAFGALENVDSAISSGKIDSFDILFVKDANGKPYVGWVDKDGNKVICDDSVEFAALEDAIATKVGVDEVKVLENQIAMKVDAEVVQSMIEEHTKSVIEVVEF